MPDLNQLTPAPALQAGAANIGHVDGQGTAGTPTGGVVSVQGVSGGQALPISDAALELAQGSTTSGQKGPLVQGAVSTSAPLYTNGQTDPISLTTAGAVRVDNSANIQPSLPVAGITGGAAPFFNDAVAATSVQVKATAGQLYSLLLLNTTAATAYLQIFNKPTPTVGTDAPAMTIRLAANERLQITFPVGVALFGTGIALAGTTAPQNNTGAAISVTATYQ